MSDIFTLGSTRYLVETSIYEDLLIFIFRLQGKPSAKVAHILVSLMMAMEHRNNYAVQKFASNPRSRRDRLPAWQLFSKFPRFRAVLNSRDQFLLTFSMYLRDDNFLWHKEGWPHNLAVYLLSVGKNILNDDECALAAMRVSVEHIKWFSDRIRSDKALILRFIKEEHATYGLRNPDDPMARGKSWRHRLAGEISIPHLLARVGESLLEDKDFVLEACKYFPVSWESARANLREDPHCILAAMASSPEGYRNRIGYQPSPDSELARKIGWHDDDESLRLALERLIAMEELEQKLQVELPDKPTTKKKLKI